MPKCLATLTVDDFSDADADGVLAADGLSDGFEELFGGGEFEPLAVALGGETMSRSPVVAGDFGEVPLVEQGGVLRSYDADVIRPGGRNRNMLAHVKEEATPDGQMTLRSISGTGETVIIDDSWMADFRLKLRAHKSALALVCAALHKHCGTTETAHNSEERGP